MALSLALHGLALLPLLFAGSSGSALSDEPAVLVEISLAAPAPTPAPIDVPLPDQPPPVEASELAPSTIDLPAPDVPPPVDSAELEPIEPPPPPPKPEPQPKPKAAPKAQAKTTHSAPKPAVTQTAAPPATGSDQITRTAAASQSLIVWEHHPRFRTAPKPAVYPPRAIELGHQGEALVRVRLDPTGAAAEIVLWRGSGFELLDKAALAAVRGWQFLPAIRDGRAVAAWVEIPVRFHLR
jgi:protein TonB